MASGPSPRGRGNHRAPVQPSAWKGTIPARAGQPGFNAAFRERERDHPRAGGATAMRPDEGMLVKGPSPRGRGQPPSQIETALSPGDHPRAGGATPNRSARRALSKGPSPRGRGNHRRGHSWRGGHRTIPARAGQPLARGFSSRTRRDHPRAGGATGCSSILSGSSGGPSPRGRGNHCGDGKRAPSAGTIPARAGQPRPHNMWRKRDADHPRAGGATELQRAG